MLLTFTATTGFVCVCVGNAIRRSCRRGVSYPESGGDGINVIWVVILRSKNGKVISRILYFVYNSYN